MIQRSIESRMESWLFKNKVLLLFGPRQVGKTTVCKDLLNKHNNGQGYFLCERQVVREALESRNISQIKNLIGDNKIVVFDEAQYINDIGLSLKLLHDECPEIQIIATGSSSFELANKTNEPLTGRAIKFMMYPLSLAELESYYSSIDIQERLADFLSYGLYPEIVTQDPNLREELLINLSEQYLYKDLIQFENLKNSKKIIDLLKLLALQLGSEVSINELATQLGFSRAVVERFLDLLEKMFVIIRVGSFSRNLRKEISKKAKYYFYDLGMRNAIINTFSPPGSRADIGALWENFCILERIKFWHNQGKYPNIYFWRTHGQQEIDYLEEKDDKITGFEFKWKIHKKYRVPKVFIETYPNSDIKVISPTNLQDLLN